MPDVEAQIDRLYQLPLNEFTPARNALAKELKRGEIKTLEKPNSSAWAVNQLYWRERATYDRVITTAERLRAEHRKLLGGRTADIRGTEQAHRDAIREAIDAVRQILEASDQTASPATMTAVQETLEALPADEAPGRLTRPLKPRGFEALQGIPIKPQLHVVRPDRPGRSPEPSAQESGSRPQGGTDTKSRARERAEARRREKEERERKQRKREAEQALKAAEAAMLRAEGAVKTAEKHLAELRARRDEAVSEYQRARLRAHE